MLCEKVPVVDWCRCDIIRNNPTITRHVTGSAVKHAIRTWITRCRRVPRGSLEFRSVWRPFLFPFSSRTAEQRQTVVRPTTSFVSVVRRDVVSCSGFDEHDDRKQQNRKQSKRCVGIDAADSTSVTSKSPEVHVVYASLTRRRRSVGRVRERRGAGGGARNGAIGPCWEGLLGTTPAQVQAASPATASFSTCAFRRRSKSSHVRQHAVSCGASITVLVDVSGGPFTAGMARRRSTGDGDEQTRCVNAPIMSSSALSSSLTVDRQAPTPATASSSKST